MKSGFKPKLWTKKEWLDADPSAKTKNCGIEAALDEWQKHCKAKFADMTPVQLDKAEETAKKLSDAMTKASKLCDPKAQKETLMGIFEYKKRADDYQQYAKLASATLKKRDEYGKTIKSLESVLKDSAVAAVFERYAKQPHVDCWCNVETLRLFAQKKYAEAVLAYSNKGVGGGDYNIEAKDNKVLYDTFVAKVRHEQDDILGAISRCINGQKEMLSDKRHYGEKGMQALPEWKELLAKKLPIKEYSLG